MINNYRVFSLGFYAGTANTGQVSVKQLNNKSYTYFMVNQLKGQQLAYVTHPHNFIISLFFSSFSFSVCVYFNRPIRFPFVVKKPVNISVNLMNSGISSEI